ncbi:MAG: 1,4-dihydroxy-2-naphthoate polyprenyltransferase [Chloroflexi bacterium]|nr:1,4-dihydroxy-2-naphthoate polyprenyltransferase [Chloroflexota bacterium]
MSAEELQKMSSFKAWLLAARPKTLPAAAAPVVVASALAYLDGRFDFFPALAALLGALLLQVGSNVANDLYDFMRGSDAGERLGPMRVTQAGLIPVAQVRRGMYLIFALAALIGMYLVFHAGWVVVAIGVAAIFAAVAYTGGPFPYGYHGLGDVFVFIFFGLAATVGTYYVQSHTTSALAWWLAIVMGLLIVGILVVNNIRDIESDRQANKRTLAVIFGLKFVQGEYVACIVGAYLIPVLIWLLGLMPVTGFLVLLSIPMAARLIQTIYTEQGRALNKTLAGTGRLTLIYAVLFLVGILLQGLV